MTTKKIKYDDDPDLFRLNAALCVVRGMSIVAIAKLGIPVEHIKPDMVAKVMVAMLTDGLREMDSFGLVLPRDVVEDLFSRAAISLETGQSADIEFNPDGTLAKFAAGGS